MTALPALSPVPSARRLIDVALRDKGSLRARAAEYFTELAFETMAGSDMERVPGTLRGSDHGRCVRELWADIHDKKDIPVDFELQLTRYDSGHLYALWMACCMKVGVEVTMPGFLLELEYESEYRGVRGHIDALLLSIHRTGLDDGTDYELVPRHVFEFKTNYQARKIGEPGDYQLSQAVDYALGSSVPTVSVVIVGPSANGARFVQHNYFASDYQRTVDEDIDRMTLALGDDMPAGDPVESWRCSTCAFSACERNTNPLAYALLEVAS